MGILNITPDSFSDGGRFVRIDRAIGHALAMAEAGADFIDVGGESTRPGATPVTPEVQCERVVEVIEALRGALPGAVRISIDTTLTAVARPALDVGAEVVNDISAGRDDPAMFALCAEREATLALMHMRGRPATMNLAPRYDDVVAEVLSFLRARVALAEAAGIPRERIWLDPGIAFGKRRCDNLALLAHLGGLVATGYPILLGVSRKRFMGSVVREQDPSALLPATLAATALGVMAGVRILRVHDVAENRQAADTAWAVREAMLASGD